VFAPERDDEFLFLDPEDPLGVCLSRLPVKTARWHPAVIARAKEITARIIGGMGLLGDYRGARRSAAPAELLYERRARLYERLADQGGCGGSSDDQGYPGAGPAGGGRGS